MNSVHTTREKIECGDDPFFLDSESWTAIRRISLISILGNSFSIQKKVENEKEFIRNTFQCQLLQPALLSLPTTKLLPPLDKSKRYGLHS